MARAPVKPPKTAVKVKKAPPEKGRRTGSVAKPVERPKAEAAAPKALIKNAAPKTARIAAKPVVRKAPAPKKTSAKFDISAVTRAIEDVQDRITSATHDTADKLANIMGEIVALKELVQQLVAKPVETAPAEKARRGRKPASPPESLTPTMDATVARLNDEPTPGGVEGEGQEDRPG